jgi:uncharacterized protein
MMSNFCFALSKEKFGLLLHKNLDAVKERYENLFSIMISQGVVIPTTLNETELIQMKNRKRVFDSSRYRLIINPTLECNFNCWYCYEKHPKGYMSKDTMKSVVKHVERMIIEDGVKHIELDWFGGEPLLYYDEILFPLSKEIMTIAKKNNATFSNSITTNGFLMDRIRIDSFNDISLFDFQITLDGNKELHDKAKYNEKGGSYERIIENLKTLVNLENTSIQLRINYTKKTLKKISKILNDLPESESSKKKIQIFFQQVWQDAEQKKISSESVQELFRQKGFNVKDVHITSCFYTCYADCYYQSVINYNGDVFKCTARDFFLHQPDGKLSKDGKIDWDETIRSKRLGKATFENQKCLSCDYLPICMGPCSQKILELPSFGEFDFFCDKAKIITSIEFLLDKFYKKLQR